MVTKYIPSTTNAILVGDKGTNGATPQPTMVGTNLSSSIMELQSTTRAALDVRMTTNQLNAIPYLVNGMRAFNTDLQAMVVYANNAWVAVAPNTNTLLITGTLTAAQMNGAYTAGFPLIPAQGAHQCIVVKGFSLELISDGTPFTGGGAISLQFDVTAHAGGTLVTSTIPATFLTGAGVNRFSFVAGSSLAALTASYVNTPICIVNDTAPFAAGGVSTITYNIWYSVIPTA